MEVFFNFLRVLERLNILHYLFIDFLFYSYFYFKSRCYYASFADLESLQPQMAQKSQRSTCLHLHSAEIKGRHHCYAQFKQDKFGHHPGAIHCMISFMTFVLEQVQLCILFTSLRWKSVYPEPEKLKRNPSIFFP